MQLASDPSQPHPATLAPHLPLTPPNPLLSISSYHDTHPPPNPRRAYLIMSDVEGEEDGDGQQQQSDPSGRIFLLSDAAEPNP